MPQLSANLTILTHQILRNFERLSIQIDDDQVGEIGNNEELRIPVSVGKHVITSKGLWGTKAYPLHITINQGEDIQIAIEPVAGQSKYRFTVETNILPANQLNEIDLLTKTLAWDIAKEISILKVDDSTIVFDLPNISFSQPLQFVIDIHEQSLKVFADCQYKMLLYESNVNKIESLSYPFIMIDNIIDHAFYRSDGTLLGFLSLESGNWVVSTHRQEKIAEICMISPDGKLSTNQDHYLLSLKSEYGIIAYKKWVRNNVLQFQNINIPDYEHYEILLLAFITFSALSWGKIAEYASERVPVALTL